MLNEKGEKVEKVYKFHKLSKEEPLDKFSWKDYFYPIPNYSITHMTFNGSDTGNANSFIVFISYPVSYSTFTTPYQNYIFESVQMVCFFDFLFLSNTHRKKHDETLSNEWFFTGNVFVDFEHKYCSVDESFSYTLDYETALNQWSNMMDVTGWTFGKDLSLLISFSMDNFFCFALTEYVFLSNTKKVSKNWRYCNKNLEDPGYEEDGCCNPISTEKCNTYQERKSIYIQRGSVCSWDASTLTEKNLSYRESIRISSRSAGMQEFTQVFHDFVFETIPTIISEITQETNKKRNKCRNILRDPDSYKLKFLKCPIPMESFEDFPATTPGGCYVPSHEEENVFVDICEGTLQSDGSLAEIQLQQLKEIIENAFVNETTTIVIDKENPAHCYSYKGEKLEIQQGENSDCTGYVCEYQNSKLLFQTIGEARAHCPEQFTQCVLPSYGCAVDSSLGNYLINSSNEGESYNSYIKIYKITQDECNKVQGFWIKDIDSNTNDPFNCLSQIYGCVIYDGVQFQHCSETAIYSNLYKMEDHVISTAYSYKPKRLENDLESSYRKILNKKNLFDKDYDKKKVEQIKQYVPVLFKFYNREVAQFIVDCLSSGNENYLSQSLAYPLTIKTLNRDKSNSYTTIEISSKTEDDDDEVTIYEFDRCYACGSSVLIGVQTKSLVVNKAEQVPVGNIFNNYSIAKSNLGFEIPVFYNDTIGGLDINFPIAYIIGDGLILSDITNTHDIDVYVGISELPTVDFIKTDTFQYPDFVKVTNYLSSTNETQRSYEPMYLKCLKTHSDENTLVFDFTNAYTFCLIPKDILKELTDSQMLFPVYRLPKKNITKTYPEANTTGSLVWKIVLGIVGVVVLCISVIALIIFIVRYRKQKGKQMLRLYDENELSSLGGPLIQYA